MKKRAFTLTELLVVVVIIATLSAVVLPKFTKVLETRKTTEAESILQAVRAEQEARCTLDKNYTTNTAELATYPQNGAKNYNFEFRNTGMIASAKGKAYSLQIKSYADGGICCEGDYCANLNKHYPTCGSYTPAKSGAECAAGGGSAPEPEPACALKDYTKQCSEVKGPEWEGTVTYTVNADCTGYVENTTSCIKKACQPTNGNSFYEYCPEDTVNYQGRVVYTWNPSTCSYDKDSSDCGGCAPTNQRKERYDSGESCPVDRPSGAIEMVWNYDRCKYEMKDSCWCDDQGRQGCEENGTWNISTCTCDCPKGTTWDPGSGQCDSGSSSCDPDGHRRRDCDHENGIWDSATCECSCPEGYMMRNGRCECGTQELLDICHYGVDQYSQHGGDWSFSECKCVCNDGYSPANPPIFCTQIPGHSANGDDCWPEGPWCDEWEQDFWEDRYGY